MRTTMQLNVGSILQRTRAQTPLITTTTTTTTPPRVPSQQHHQTHQNYHIQQQQQQQRSTRYNPVHAAQPTPIPLPQGAKKIKAYTHAYYERLIGKWILSNETNVLGPFDPLDLDLFLSFLQTTTTSFNNNYNLLRFCDQLMDKECRWIETYPRPWELLSSVQRMVSAGRERDQILDSLSVACMRTGGELTVTTVRQSTVGYGGGRGGGYAVLSSLNGHRSGGFGSGRVG